MAATVKSTLLTEGKALINGALIGYSRFAAHSYRLGSGAGHEVSQSRTDIVGALVYTGDASLIASRTLDGESVRYTLTVPEGVGPFEFGSIILYANAMDGAPLAMVEIALPFAIRKELADPDLTNESPFPKPGSRLIISIVLRHKVVDSEVELVNVSITPAAFANMAVFDSDVTLPPPLTQPWNQFMMHNHTGSGTPALGLKRADNTYWGMPAWRNLHHPNFGVIDGGVQGDAYQTEQNGWLWGHRYSTPEEHYHGTIGGYGYDTLLTSPLILGGSSY